MNRVGEKLLEIMEREGVRDLPELVDRINEAREQIHLPVPEVAVEGLAAYMTAPEDERPDLRAPFFVALGHALGLSQEQTAQDMIDMGEAEYTDRGGAFDNVEPPQPGPGQDLG